MLLEKTQNLSREVRCTTVMAASSVVYIALLIVVVVAIIGISMLIALIFSLVSLA